MYRIMDGEYILAIPASNNKLTKAITVKPADIYREQLS